MAESALKKKRKPKKKVQHWRINEYIRVDEARVILEEKQLGVMSIGEALKLAREAGLDLVEIAPKAKPPVLKIVDFGKFRYREEKKNKGSKPKTSELKEVRLSPFIGDADYNTRLARIKGFLDGGSKVRVVVKFKGRQMGSKQFGYGVLKRILGDVGTEINVDMEPKFVGRHLTMVISPTARGKRQELKGKEHAKTKN